MPTMLFRLIEHWPPESQTIVFRAGNELEARAGGHLSGGFCGVWRDCADGGLVPRSAGGISAEPAAPWDCGDKAPLWHGATCRPEGKRELVRALPHLVQPGCAIAVRGWERARLPSIGRLAGEGPGGYSGVQNDELWRAGFHD